MHPTFLQRSLIVVLCGSIFGCADTEIRPDSRHTREFPDYSYRETESVKGSRSLPWETWAPFQDLTGRRLVNPDLILGDELLKKGQRRLALDAYMKTVGVRMLPHEEEAAALRLSSQYLALEQPKRALATISSYFREKGLGEEQVDLAFSLVLAFAYGRQGQSDQALAWFSRAYRQSKGNGYGADVSQKGIALYVGSLSQNGFEQVAINWRTDAFVNEAVGKERLRRASRSYDPDDVRSDKPFWGNYDSLDVEVAPSIAVDSGAPTTGLIGLVLSLSDRFGSLGRDTRQGVELAVLADHETPPFRVEVRDVGADTAGASAAVRELVGGMRASVVVGPLLTEAAVAAADTARELGAPLISFSKSESFRTGGGVFRLGATTSSQIDALLNVAVGEFRLSKFAVIAPQNANGTEYLQVMRRKVGALGATLSFEGVYGSADDATFAQLAGQLENSGADAVLLPDTIETSARFLSALSPAAKRRIRPLGTALWDSAIKIANSQAVFERALFVTPFFPQSTRPVVKQFIDSYRGKFQSMPNFLAAQGFDVGTLVVNALRQSLRDNTPFAESLSRLPPYDGVTGFISSSAPGELKRLFYVVEVTRDTFLEKAPAGDPQVTRETITYRGNQQVDPRTQQLVRDPEATVASGY